MSEELISVARIVRPHGRHGEVVADLLTDFPERFEQLDAPLIRRTDGNLLTLKIERSRLTAGRIVIKFSGVESIDDAEQLRNALLQVGREQLVPLPADTYYDFELIGCQVTTGDGQRLGSVSNIHRYGAAPLLVVVDEEKGERLIPLVRSICLEIDIAGKRILVEPPEGLLDL
ncbi:MAG: ribosome maturation factor RimM [Acidobacteria bacterium]|nr:ribosome maturation factor RimM [Acidobacteriota bacterium]